MLCCALWVDAVVMLCAHLGCMAVDVHRCLHNNSGIYEIMGGEALVWRDFAGSWSMWDDVRFDEG